MKKFVSILVSLTMFASMFVGCSKTTTTKPANQKSENTQSVTQKADTELKANLRVLYPGTSDTEKEVAEDIKMALEKKYPGINVEYIYLGWGDIEKKLAIMAQSNDYPDVMMVQDVINYVAMDALEPMEQYLGNQLSKEVFSPAAFERLSIDGTLYGIPALTQVYSHVLNQSLLEQAGMSIDDIKSWDDVKKAVDAMSKDNVKGYAMANGGEGRFTFRDFMMIAISNGFWPDDTSEEAKSKYIETLAFVNDLREYMPESQVTWLYPELFKAWEAQEVGMMHTGSYFTSNVLGHGTKSLPNTKVFPMPKGPSGDETQVMVGAVGWSIIKGSTQKEAAWKYIEIAMSEPILGKLSGALHAPAVNYIKEETLLESAKKVYGDSGQAHTDLVNQFKMVADQYGVPVKPILGQPAIEKVVQGAIVKMLYKKITPEQAYEEIKVGIDSVKSQVGN